MRPHGAPAGSTPGWHPGGLAEALDRRARPELTCGAADAPDDPRVPLHWRPRDHCARRVRAACARGLQGGEAAAGEAARAALAAAGAAFLHPLARATQVKHILGSAAHAARAFELAAGDDPAVGAAYVAQLGRAAPPLVADVLRRYPAAPPGGGRVGELLRALDAALR